MPSTRTRLQLRSPPVGHQVETLNGTQTLDTLSTAVLPTSYTVLIASAQPISDDEKARSYQVGQEFLNDGVRRINDKEGDLSELRARKRRRVAVEPDAGSIKLETGVYWYTAHLQYPCSCALVPLSRAFTIRHPPTAARDLEGLPDQTESDRVRLGDEVPEWDTGQAGYVDLEPDLSDLKPFEHGWREAPGLIWRHSQQTGRFCDVFDEQNQELEPVQLEDRSYEMVKESLSTRRLRKGKFKAVDLHPSSLVPIPIPIPNALSQGSPRQIRTKNRTEERDVQKSIEWEAESRRRKQLWRVLIGKDPGFGQFWKKLPRPHAYSSIGSSPDLPRPPDYNLFRNYQTATHPFHPDLCRYVQKSPYGRLYWLVPIHGPVVVPSLNDDTLESGSIMKEKEIPIPSPATFSTNFPGSTPGKLSRPAPIRWTPELLEHFLNSFLLPLRQSKLFSLSLVFSGPKPDPFIALPSPAPITRHQHLRKEKTTEATDDTMKPIRSEAGDHLRMYCDAKEALSLRTWLNGVAIDPTIVGPTREGVENKPWKLFDKVRLCLIGERGEVLMVA